MIPAHILILGTFLDFIKAREIYKKWKSTYEEIGVSSNRRKKKGNEKNRHRFIKGEREKARERDFKNEIEKNGKNKGRKMAKMKEIKIELVRESEED